MLELVTPRRVDALSNGVHPVAARDQRWLVSLATLAIWCAIVIVAVLWGRSLVHAGTRLGLGAPPLWSRRDWKLDLSIVPSAVIAGLVVGFGARMARRLAFPLLVTCAAATATLWAACLLFVGGAHALVDPAARAGYATTAARFGNLHAFLAHFAATIASYNVHTRGHPPGMVVVFWGLRHVGLEGAGAAAALAFGGGALAVVAVLVALRDVAGESAARAASPFLVLAPAAVMWSSADAFFAGCAAWSVALIVLATGRRGRSSAALAIAGGVLLGVTANLSYGLVLLAVLPVAVAIARRRLDAIAAALCGTLAVVAAFASAGFWWYAGLVATRHQYLAGIASRRPYAYFLLGNLAAFALVTGPAVAVALARVRDRALWLLVGGILAVVLIADVSGMSKGEVERIWLPFAPWAMLATAAFGLERRGTERWLGLQAAGGMLLEVAVRSKW